MRSYELPMSCICREDGKAIALANRERVAEIFDIVDHTSRMHWATDMVHALNQAKGMWHVDGVGADQWLGVGITALIPQTPNQEDGGERYYIQCDRLEDGLTSLYLHVYDLYGNDDD